MVPFIFDTGIHIHKKKNKHALLDTFLSTFSDLHNYKDKIYCLNLLHNDVFILSAHFCDIKPNQVTKDVHLFSYCLMCGFFSKIKIVSTFVLSLCTYPT